MSAFKNRDEAERLEDDGKTRTRVEESRTVVSGRPTGSPFLADRLDQQVVDQRSVRSRAYSAATVNGLLGLLLLALETVIAFRFLFLAFGANRRAGFVDFTLDLSGPFVRPFSNAFAVHSWDHGLIEPASLLAMSVFAIVVAFIMLVSSAVIPEHRERHDVASRRTTRV
ncbi:MAG TPA: hypothetical protein VEZ14_03260 [Dehalococcoidia bacterium]|nr:hypothetical protein [Dehalococcoidia bacterium]